jgi:hypothetical protein
MIPSNVAGLVLWLKADQIALSDNAPVSVWADQSGLGNNANQGTGGAQPTLQTNEINGLPVVRFDGSDSLVVTHHSSILPSTLSIFIVAKQPVSANAIILTKLSAFDSVNSGYAMRYRTSNAIWFLQGDFNLPQILTATALATTAFGLIGTVDNGTNGFAYLNGTQVHTAATGFSYADTVDLTIGSLIAASGDFLIGDIAEIIMYNTALSATDRNRLGGYIQGKYGLTIAGATFEGELLGTERGASSVLCMECPGSK